MKTKKNVRILLDFLSTQSVAAVDKEGWDKIDPEVSPSVAGISVTLRNQEIGFAFDPKGNFLGIYNWKG